MLIGGALAGYFNHFMGWAGVLTTYIRDGSKSAISTEQRTTISKKIRMQFDALDGPVDASSQTPKSVHSDRRHCSVLTHITAG